jgi:ATP:corrinoid adenosyltransferase
LKKQTNKQTKIKKQQQNKQTRKTFKKRKQKQHKIISINKKAGKCKTTNKIHTHILCIFYRLGGDGHIVYFL